MADLEDFNSDLEQDNDSPTLPSDDFFWGDLVSEEGMHQARIWFLFAIESYKPARGLLRPNEVIRQLRDIVLPVFRIACTTWLNLNPDVPKWKTGIPWLNERGNPIFADLWAGIEEWARQHRLTFQDAPAEWILTLAHANLTLWTMLSYRPEAELRWASLGDAFETGSRAIRGEWLKVFYNPESMRAEEAHAELDRQIQAAQGRAAKFGARSTLGLVKSPPGTLRNDDSGNPIKMPLYGEWFVRRQVCCESFDSIAKELQGYEDPHMAIQSACRDFAKLIGLTPRRDKPGPKGKHPRLGK